GSQRCLHDGVLPSACLSACRCGMLTESVPAGAPRNSELRIRYSLPHSELGTRNSELGTRNSELGTRNSRRGR
ncbi:hypothetical protein QM565_34825, partial [Geitlerinema splendidum]|nr:hypothetical protein [Geitlerinema splendidum]